MGDFLHLIANSCVQLGSFAVQQQIMKKVAPKPKEVDYVGQYLDGHSKALANYEANLKARSGVQQDVLHVHEGGPTVGIATQPINRPGCTAADEAIVALGHLEGLARGNNGFGVLRVSKERLEKAADAAEGLNHPEIAADMRAVADQMPAVHDPQRAQELADALRPVVDSAWDLGRSCKLTPVAIAKIRSHAPANGS